MALHFLVFGNHPRLSLAEFLAFKPKAKIVSQTPNTCIVEMNDWQADVLMSQLGGVIKLGDVILESKGLDLKVADIAKLASSKQEITGLEFGWTSFGGNGKERKVFEKYPLHIKRALKDLGWKVRWVSGEGGQPLSPAAVAKCHLTEQPNADFCLMLDKGKTFLGRTTNVQDADAWSLRDYGRPCRDDINGMLPPKLARMMVNLAQTPDGGTLLDPFCGSGTILMEAALATSRTKIIGSDIDERQTDDTSGNLEWLLNKNILSQDDETRFKVFTSDVKEVGHYLSPKSIDAVVTEGWLGPALRGRESLGEIQKNASQITQLWKDALAALKPLMKKDGRIVAIFPSYKVGSQIIATDSDIDFASLGFALEDLPANLRQMDMYYERTGQHLRRNVRILAVTSNE
ncbi:MAG: DNA methyltransferase [Patescibacteria group bacterium]|nr:DNA methyltransferase [Patescibacteria group bacterium]